MAFPSLNRSQVRRVSKTLRAAGRKLPKVGRCATNLPPELPAKELCHDPRGYFYVGYRSGSFGRYRRKRRR